MTDARFTSYRAFWPFYVSQHSRPGTRALHFLGTVSLLPCALAAALVDPLWGLAAPVLAYGLAWIGHLFVERNRPATFRYPLWSLRGDFHMFACMLRGRMGAELERARAAGHLDR